MMRIGDDSVLPEDLPETITIPGVDYKVDVPRTTSWLQAPVTMPRWGVLVIIAALAINLLGD